MTGKYDIEVYNNRVHYFLTVKRNITIIQGHSATGKTELLRLISDYEENGTSSGITVKCDTKCTVLTSVDWELRLKELKKCIVFIDETAVFLKTKEFAELVRRADNYFVIVTRDDLNQLPYSIDEIYGLKNASDTSKYKSFKKTYNEMYNLYNFNGEDKVSPGVVVTEDTNSGLEFFQLVYGNNCHPAGGKSKVFKLIHDNKDANLLVIVDGAAFGPEIGKVFRYLKLSGQICVIYAPESFEYLVLKSGLIEVPKSIVEETYMHADSVDFISWEEYYTHMLTKITRNTVFQYSKSRLNDSYKTKGAMTRMLDLIPKQILPDSFKR